VLTPRSPRCASSRRPPEGVAFGEIPAGESVAKSVELRNVFPSKLALGFAFAVLGLLVFPGLAERLAGMFGKMI
jgi:hypothetical protein